MFSILRNLIMSGSFSIEILAHKVQVAWADGSISDEEKLTLDNLIFQHKNPQTQSPELMEMMKMIVNKYSDLESRVSELENKIGSSGEERDGDPTEEPVTIPEWEQWDGISNKYQYGDVVTHNDKYWINVLSGMQNTWEPEGIGVDERYWKEITKEQAEGIVKGTLTVDEILNPENVGEDIPQTIL